MKKAFLLSSLLLLFLPTLCRAQNYMVPTEAGTILEYASYDNDGTVINRITKTVETSTATPRGTEVVLRTDILDAEGVPDDTVPPLHEKILITADKIIKIQDASANFLKQMIESQMVNEQMSAEQREAMKNVNFVVAGDDVVYPASPKSGDKIPKTQATVIMTYKNARDKDKSMKLVTVSGEGKIESPEESITTEAGTFRCVKISKTARIKMLIGILSETQRMVSWYAPGIGEVMTQEVTKKGEVESTTRLISIKKP